MDVLDDQDLFDALGICFREDSYTELIANIFQNDPEVAREFYARTVGPGAPAGPIRCKTRVALIDGASRNIPDLVVLFGDPETHAWMIEAKIEAGEGRKQTERYLARKESLKAALDLPDSVQFCTPVFLTLDRCKPGSPEWQPADYRALGEIVEPERFEQTWMREASRCLRDRFRDYYREKDQALDPAETLDAYLRRAKGLVTRRDLFYRLMGELAARVGFTTEPGMAQNRGSAKPITLHRPAGSQWVSGADLLGDSRNVHFEVFLADEPREADGGHLKLVLHYETEPYTTRKALRGNAEADRYHRVRDRFFEEIQRYELEELGWVYKKNSNQLMRAKEFFPLGGAVRELEEWLNKLCAGAAPGVQRAVEATSAAH